MSLELVNDPLRSSFTEKATAASLASLNPAWLATTLSTMFTLQKEHFIQPSHIDEYRNNRSSMTAGIDHVLGGIIDLLLSDSAYTSDTGTYNMCAW